MTENKEFEKWWVEMLNGHWSHYDKGVCRIAWKAALEWALKWGLSRGKIEEELDEETEK